MVRHRAHKLIVGTLVVLALLASMVATADEALACSCAQGPSTAPLDSLDAALVGIAEEVVGHARIGGGTFSMVRFDVTEVIKGDFDEGDDAYLFVKEFDDSCGRAQFIPGGRMFGSEAGIQIRDGDLPLVSEICTSTDADYVRQGVPGLDQPVSDAPVDRLIVGRFRGTSIRMLDAENNIVKYVKDQNGDFSPSMCPDNITLTTIATPTSGPVIRWRNLETLEISDEQPLVGEAGLPDGFGDARLSIDRCIDGNTVLVRGFSNLWLVSPGGPAESIPFGEFRSGSISTDGDLFAQWSSVFNFEVRSLDGSEPTTTGTVSNHRGADLELSPDGTMLAFYRRKPPLTRIDMEVVIVDRSGAEQHVILDQSFAPVSGIRWLDDDTLLSGASVIDISGPTPVVTAGPPLGFFPSKVSERVVLTEDDAWTIFDTSTGEQTARVPWRPARFGWPFALPSPITVTGTGLEPDVRPVAPLPGESVPTSLKELSDIVRAHPDSTLNPDIGYTREEISPSLGQVLLTVIRRASSARTRMLLFRR